MNEYLAGTDGCVSVREPAHRELTVACHIPTLYVSVRYRMHSDSIGATEHNYMSDQLPSPPLHIHTCSDELTTVTIVTLNDSSPN